MASSYLFTINGVNRSNCIINRTPEIHDKADNTPSDMGFEFENRDGGDYIEPDDEVVLTVDGVKLFGGYAVTIEPKRVKDGQASFDVDCIDYTRVLDRRLVVESYQDMTDKAIIEHIITNYCQDDGFTAIYVEEGITINQISFNYVPPSEALTRIAKLTGRNWFVDYDKNVHYFPLNSSSAPFDIGYLDFQDSFNDNSVDSLKWTNNNPTYIFEANNQLEFHSHTSSQYTWIKTVDSFNLTSKGVSVEIIDNGDPAILSFEFYPITLIQDSDNQLFFLLSRGGIAAYKKVSGTPTSLRNATFNSVNHRYLRIREEAGTTYFETSPSGEINSWTVFHSLANEITMTSMSLSIQQGTYDSESITTIAKLDKVRIGNMFIANDYKDLKIKKDNSNLRNRVYVRGGTKLSDEILHEEKTDGVKTIWILPYKPHDLTMEVGGVAKTVGIKNVDNVADFDYLMNFQEKTIELASDSLPSDGTTMSFSFKYDVPVLIALENSISIDDVGVFEYAIFDNTITTNQQARDRASAELSDFASTLIDGKFKTLTTGFRAGQTININQTEIGINEDYLIQSVEMKSFGSGMFEYTITVASAKKVGIIQYLINLIEQNKNRLNISDEEVVDELFSITGENFAMTDSAPDLSGVTISTDPFEWNNFDWEFAEWM